MVSELRRFKEKYRHCFIPINYFPNRRLSRWIDLHRVSFRHQSRVLVEDNGGSSDDVQGASNSSSNVTLSSAAKLSPPHGSF